MTEEERSTVIREICAREGHGHTSDVTTMGSLFRELVCDRGCGVRIYVTYERTTIAEIVARVRPTGAEIVLPAGQTFEVIGR